LGAVLALLAVIGLFAAAAPGLSSIAQARIQTVLQDRFDSDLQIQNLKVSLFPSVAISGESVVFHRKGHPNDPPLIQIARFTAGGNILGLLARHVTLVRLEGLDIRVPPKESGNVKTAGGSGKTPYFVIDQIIADGTKLSTIPRESWKEPLVFDIKTLRMYGGGSNSAFSFDAILTNAKPPGEIRSKGKFGPWDKNEPGDSPVSGSYTFRNADLSVFKGISGRLSSDGNYKGSLGHIEAAGHTDVPDFMVTLAGNPVHLTTEYQAIIDGTSGNTYLQPVTAKFGHSTIVAKGSVEGKRGSPGKTVMLDAVVDEGRLEDMLQLGVHSKTPPLSGAISFHSKIVIPPGHTDVMQKLKLDGAFAVVDPFFKKKGSAAGAVIPIAISGTIDKPSFGLDVFHRGDE
jgi:hypothetical protein